MNEIPKNRFPMPSGENPPNPWGYDYWPHMHKSVYYRPVEVEDVFCFKIDGQDARMRIGYYEQDPRWMRVSFENRDGEEMFVLTEYLRGVYNETDLNNPSAYIPRYGGLCHDHVEGAPEGLFEQLIERCLCVPVYGEKSGRISARGAEYGILLPEYMFDEEALLKYDYEGMASYDAQLAASDTALALWPGSERTFARAVAMHYNPDLDRMFDWPIPAEYTGPGRNLEDPDVPAGAYIDKRVLIWTFGHTPWRAEMSKQILERMRREQQDS